jgi:hypothetical protein
VVFCTGRKNEKKRGGGGHEKMKKIRKSEGKNEGKISEGKNEGKKRRKKMKRSSSRHTVMIKVLLACVKLIFFSSKAIFALCKSGIFIFLKYLLVYRLAQ